MTHRILDTQVRIFCSLNGASKSKSVLDISLETRIYSKISTFRDFFDNRFHNPARAVVRISSGKCARPNFPSQNLVTQPHAQVQRIPPPPSPPATPAHLETPTTAPTHHRKSRLESRRASHSSPYPALNSHTHRWSSLRWESRPWSCHFLSPAGRKSREK